MLYESLAPINTSTERTRGFCLLTKSYLNYAKICRTSEDYISKDNVKKWFELHDTKEDKKNIEQIKGMILTGIEDLR